MQKNFAQVPKADTPRSQFNRSCGYKTTFDAGYLIPFFVDEAMPGDTFNLKSTVFARMATPLKALMDNLEISTFYFGVPIRLVWDNFPKFLGEQDNPGDSTDYTMPTMDAPAGTGYATGSLQDYMGIPIGIAELEHRSDFLRAYNLIWNIWFRDQNLQDSVVVDKDDGPDDPADYVLLKRCKRHDYFTSGLPWPQKGDAITLPLGTYAPVELDPTLNQYQITRQTTDHAIIQTSVLQSAPATAYLRDTGGTTVVIDPGDTLRVDLSSATSATINSIRQAFQLQILLERDARGGTRHQEIIRAHFGVESPDARMQRPEYLGGGRAPVNIHPVPQMSQSDTTQQGTMGAFGTASFSGHGFTKSFTEHTLLIGLVCVSADLTYQQGLARMWSRSTKWDHYWPALAHLGEQGILNKELYAQNDANDDLIFAYQERWAEYRYKESLITGLFRSTAASSLDAYHLSQEFGSLPTLNSTFIQETPPMDRVVAVPAEPDFILDAVHNLVCARPMPVFGVPGLVDHF